MSTPRSLVSPTSLFVVAVLLAAPAGSARASFQTLAERLPAATNAVVAVNVDKVLNSSIATEEQWRQNLADSWAKQPVMVPAGATRVLAASYLRTSDMEPYWEMSMMELAEVPSVEELAKAEGGYVDRVWDKPAVCSPINAYFVPLDGTILASITPADRSEIARWVRQPVKPGGNVTSAYIRDVVAALGANTDIVMALDLEGAFGLPQIRRFLANAEIKEFPATELDAVAGVLGTLKGLTLDVTVANDVRGKVTVQFDRDAAKLRAGAKPLMIAILNAAGMRVDDLREWAFVTSGTQVRAEGKLSLAALRRLLSTVQSPIPAATTAQKPAGGDPKAPADPAVASQRYYKAICASLDQLRAGASPGDTAVWIRNTARRIDQLPILNVDPALVEWAGVVGSKLKQAGGILGVGQTQMNARVAGVMDPDFGASGYDSNGYYWRSDYYNDAQVENARRQRRQVALEQKAQALEQALAVINTLPETRSQIRAKMVEKYRVEF